MSDTLTLEAPAIVALGTVDLRLIEADEFKRAKTTVLQLLSVVGSITTQEELQAAVEASASAGFLLSGAEKCRKAVKEPYWNAGKQIDAFYETVTSKLIAARTGADYHIATFKRAELQRQREAEAAAQAEQRRLEAERQAALAKARQAETEEQRNAELAKAKAAQEAAKVALPPVPVAKTVGLSATMRKVPRIIDAALAYQTKPHFFELTPKLAVINEAIRGGFTGCPGIVVEEEINVKTR